MCKAYYLASSHPLPSFNMNRLYPEILVSPHLYGAKEAVQKILQLPYIYYVGSWEGCSCGFTYLTQEENEASIARTGDEGLRDGRQKSVVSVGSLSRYLVDQIEGGELSLYVTEDGEQGSPIQARKVITPSFFSGETFGPVENHILFRIVAGRR